MDAPGFEKAMENLLRLHRLGNVGEEEFHRRKALLEETNERGEFGIPEPDEPETPEPDEPETPEPDEPETPEPDEPESSQAEIKYPLEGQTILDSAIDTLERLVHLKDSGGLTDEEFEILKARLVGIEPNAPTPSEQVPIPTAEAVGEEVSAYEMTDWTTEDQEAFSQLLVDLGVPHEFDNEGDLIVSPLNRRTVDQAMDDFLGTPDGQPDTEAVERSPAFYRRHWTDKIPGLRFSSWLILGFNSWMAMALVSALISSTSGSCQGLSGSRLEACQAGAAIGASLGAGLILIAWAAIDVVLVVVWIVTRRKGQPEPEPIGRVLGLGTFLIALVLGGAALRDAILEQDVNPTPNRSPVTTTSRSPVATTRPPATTVARTTAPEPTVSQGFGSQDASADMVDIDCGEVDILGFRYPAVTVKNNSSKTSSYWITIVVESKDRTVRYDETFVIINSLDPGQITTEEGLPFTEEFPPGSQCRITEVSRTAS